jgi:hypothetical protein
MTINGLQHLINGLHYVTAAVSFFGFIPKDHHIALKLQQAIHNMEIETFQQLQQQEQLVVSQREAAYAAEQLVFYTAACHIQSYMIRYHKRQYFYHLYIQRRQQQMTLRIQRIYRGFVGRRIFRNRRTEYFHFLANTPYTIYLQRWIRGFLSRRFTNGKAGSISGSGSGMTRVQPVSQRIREMYFTRQRESYHSIVIAIQCLCRRYLARRRFHLLTILSKQIKTNQEQASIFIQKLIRKFLARLIYYRRKYTKYRIEMARHNAAMKIVKFCEVGIIRYKSRLTGEALRRFYRVKWTASECIQRIYRGYRCRQRLLAEKITNATRYFAAREIQRIFRGSRILHWRDMRLNVIAAYVLDRQYVERLDRVHAAKYRYLQFTRDNTRDSASDEPDDEEKALANHYPYTEHYDLKKQRKYWCNYMTNEITYIEPHRMYSIEEHCINKRCKVYWVIQQAWYEGMITRYHYRKHRHRIEYDDGDHEWISLDKEKDRIQILLQDHETYAMYQYYVDNEAISEERRKYQEKKSLLEYQQQAYRDAKQWKLFTDDHTGQIMFLSEMTGELRTGSLTAIQWQIIDDHYGFPCFYNHETQQIVYEDPRFLYDVEEDLLQQRRYIMQEIRFAVYICKDLYDQYQQTLFMKNDINNRQQNKIMFQIRNTPKITQLSALIIRAKALHPITSIVDKPMHTTIYEELDYAQWLVNTLSMIIDAAEVTIRQRQDLKRSLVEKLSSRTKKKKVFCLNCQRETKRNLDFCPNCGNQQIMFDERDVEEDVEDVEDNVPTSEMVVTKNNNNNNNNYMKSRGQQQQELVPIEEKNEENYNTL